MNKNKTASRFGSRRKIFFRIFAAFVLTGMLCSCGGYWIGVPAAGERADYAQTEGDGMGRFVISLPEKCRGLRYNGFSIANPHDARYAVFVRANSANVARWHTNLPLKTGQDFQCSVIRIELPPLLTQRVRDLDSLAEYCRAKYGRDPRTLTFHCDTVRDGENGDRVEFQVRARLPETGVIALSSGRMMLVPDEPGVLLEISYFENGYEITPDKRDPRLRELGEKFLSLVRVPAED